MKSVLIVYCKENEKAKYSNEEKTAIELEKLFTEKGLFAKRFLIETQKKIGLKEMVKLEKEIKFKNNAPPIKNFDLIIIGTPIVGSLTSSPLINAFIRNLPKGTTTKPSCVLYSTGIIQGFAIKKMQSLLSMHGIKPLDSETFTSIFEFDTKKLLEIKKFFERFMAKLNN